jgi:(S)-ureidoglycine aminohydrolase
MPDLFGHSRARIAARHALITPANHVASSVPGFTGATSVILVNEAMGAKFAQVLVTFTAEGRAAQPASEVQTFGYFISGTGDLAVGQKKAMMDAGGFFFVPAGQPWGLTFITAGTQLMLFQKKYVPLPGVAAPQAIIGDSSKVKGAPFLGDPAANLQTLLPDDPAFDMAVNLFTYQPGGHLPFVEVHVMEHGLIMLGGAGVYRMEDSWYPVQAGDAIWMAPYCAQWFVAMGKTPASYLYYKDVNRPAI